MIIREYQSRRAIPLFTQIDDDQVNIAVQKVDHAYFRKNPSAEAFLRAIVPSEIEHPSLTEVPSGYVLAIKVTVGFDPHTDEIVSRARECLLVPEETELQWYPTENFLRRIFGDLYRA